MFFRGEEGDYFLWNAEKLVEFADAASKKHEELLTQNRSAKRNVSEATLKMKLREWCISQGHGMYNGRPKHMWAMEGTGDPLHSDSNDMLKRIEYLDRLCQNIDFQGGANYTNNDVSAQCKLWSAMGNLGLSAEAERLKNRAAQKTATASSKKLLGPTDFRLTGAKAAKVMRS